jgi:regulator of sigma E protease
MSIIIFILVLGLLIFIHELGHFLVAKKAGIRVDEFAVGFPPRLLSFTKGGTRYALNLIPFGGYVKIFGENPEEADKNDTKSLVSKPRYVQALVLVAGVVFNILLACLIFTILFIRGAEFNSNLVPFAPVADGVRVEYVQPDSLAMKSGLKEGDVVQSVQVTNKKVITDQAGIFEALYAEKKENTTIVLKDTEQQTRTIQLTPATSDMKFGFSLTDRVYVKTNVFQASVYAVQATAHMTKLTAVGLFDFFGQLFTGKANFQEVAGPVGIVGLVGQAAENGLNDVLFLTAIISINLAVLNLLPFPALDGGRLAVIGIEAILRRDLNYKKVAIVNVVGFFLLITLMIVLTIHDVKNLFN